MRREHGARAEVEKSNCQVMTADSWESSTVCVGDATRLEGVLGVRVVVIEPVTVARKKKGRDIEPCVGDFYLCDEVWICVLINCCNADGKKEQRCEADQDGEHPERLPLEEAQDL